jgi:hypothetical protein
VPCLLMNGEVDDFGLLLNKAWEFWRGKSDATAIFNRNCQRERMGTIY